ncbi:MAG: DUF6364 family protein [Holophagaceae bacterium]
MKLTLSIDKHLLEKARKTAGVLGLSLNEMIRNYLEKVVGGAGKADTFEELKTLCTTRGGHSRGQAWTRDDLHRG